jgi:hypothetical protein
MASALVWPQEDRQTRGLRDLTPAPESGRTPTDLVRLAGLSRLKAGITAVILCKMKTAISIPDSLFEEADRLAKRRGWSRSELYANAVAAYVNSERFSGVREKLDAVYGNDEEDSAVDPLLADAQARSLPRDKW